MTDFDHAAIDEVLHSRVRLAIVAFLAGAKTADFAAVRDATKTTDGNADCGTRHNAAGQAIYSEKENRRQEVDGQLALCLFHWLCSGADGSPPAGGSNASRCAT